MPERVARTQPAWHATSFGHKQLRTQAALDRAPTHLITICNRSKSLARADRAPTHLITICKGSKMVAALKHRANDLQPPTFHSC